MKSLRIAGITLQSQRPGRKARIVAAFLFIALTAGAAAQAGTVSVAYSNTGGLTGDPDFDGSILTLDALANGSFLSGIPSLDAVWNPVTFHTHDFLDVNTGLDSGTVTITFAGGDTLSGNIFETDSPELLNTNVGSFTQVLVFTGGTGQFAGASGSTSGGGVVDDSGEFTTTGSGTLTAAGVTSPEPATVAMMFTGLLGVVTGRKRLRTRN